MKTQPRQHISNKYNTCTVVSSPVYIGSKIQLKSQKMLHTYKYANFTNRILLLNRTEAICTSMDI